MTVPYCPLMQASIYQMSTNPHDKSKEKLDALKSLRECHSNCAWFCPGEKVCAIKLIAMQLIKVEEKK